MQAIDKAIDKAIESGLRFKAPKLSKYNELPEKYPMNTFGVFVSVERIPQLKVFPFKIHGCIGYWQKNYEPMDQLSIDKKIAQVSYDATWNDARKDYFKNTIYLDILTEYKIYHLLLPVKNVNSESGLMDDQIMFNNDKYGLIVQNGHMATYLPGVMEKSSWIEIRESLLGKANRYTTNKAKFYAYESFIQKKSIADYLIKPIINFINISYDDFIPYEITGKEIKYDTSQSVRNAAMMYHLLQATKYGYKLSDKVVNNIGRNSHYYIKNIINFDAQTKAYMMLVYNIIHNDDQIILALATDLVSSIGLLEPDFALGNVLMALTIIRPDLDYIYESIIKKFKVDDIDLSRDKIFKYNWHASFIKNISIKTENVKDYAQILANSIIYIVKTFEEFTTIETNYLAVAFEGLTSLYTIVDLDQKHVIESILPNLMVELVSRRTNQGIYKFLNGVARLDITGHILVGYYNLIDISRMRLVDKYESGGKMSYRRKYLKYVIKYNHLLNSSV